MTPGRSWPSFPPCSLPQSPHSAVQGELEEVTTLRFEGNDVFSDRALGASIMTRSTDCRGLAALRSSAGREAPFAIDRALPGPARIRTRRGAPAALLLPARIPGGAHRNRALEPERGRGWDHVPYRGRKAGAHRFPGLQRARSARRPGSPRRSAGGRMGDPLDQLVLGAARDSLTIRLRNAGYAHAEVLLDILIPAAAAVSARGSTSMSSRELRPASGPSRSRETKGWIGASYWA